ncbi:MAG TPA: hypothetical protein VFQ35_24545, partial [Polyangiaceae bacterium]|nr:hypothetical protein [Polyangiaceae bacterium]
ELVAARHPHVELCVTHELTPELSELVARAELAVFVDARHDRLDEGVLSEALKPATTSPLSGHYSNPRSLLALSQALYGRYAPAWLVTLPAHDTGLGEGISECARRTVPAALRRVDELISQALP